MRPIHSSTIKSRLIAILFLAFFPLILIAQEEGSCAEKLITAQSLFDKGLVEQVPGMLQECMKSGFNRDEYLSACKLLIQALLFEDKLVQADSAMMEFLSKNPEYEISVADHSGFVHLFNTFDVKPVVQLSLHLGTNIPFLSLVNVKTTASDNLVSSNNISDPTNFFGSLEVKIPLSEKLELNFETGYSQISFTNIESVKGLYMGSKEINYEENQFRLEIPVSITYNYLKYRNFTGYGRLGAGASLRMSTNAKPLTNDINNPGSDTGAEFNRDDSRVFLDPIVQAGTGIKYKSPGGYAFMEIRTNLGMLNQTVRGGNSAQSLEWGYGYKDDDFHISVLNINIGYTWIIYKPSKKR